MELDLQTIFRTSIIDTAAIALFFIFVCRSKQFHNSILYLGPAYISLSIGLILLSLRNEIPDFFSILLANTLMMFWLILAWRAIRVFQKLPLLTKPLLSALLMFIFLFTVFTYLQPNINARVFIFSLYAFIFSISIFRDILKPVHCKHPQIEHKFMAMIFLVFAVFIVIRLLFASVGGFDESLFASGVLQQFSFVIIEIMVILFSFGFIWLLNSHLERQVYERASELALAYEESEKSRELAITSSMQDVLTGTGNRRKFDIDVEDERDRHVRYERDLCIAFLDLDHFKSINDTYGHDTGDSVLKNFVVQVEDVIRGIDKLYRWGGEEFVLVMPETSIEEAGEVCERIREYTESHLSAGGDSVTVSIGVTQLSKVESLGEMIGRGDKLMYQAKRNGRNCVVTG